MKDIYYDYFSLKYQNETDESDLDLSAKIKKIDPFGLMDIEFNNTMFTNFTNPFNQSEKLELSKVINSSHIEISLIPSPERYIEDLDDFTFSIFKFSWTPVSYLNETLRI